MDSLGGIRMKHQVTHGLLAFIALMLLGAGLLPAQTRGSDDSSWDPRFVLPGFNGPVHAAVVWEGKLYLGGEFSAVAGRPVNGLACWDGREWSDPLESVASLRIYTLIVYQNRLVMGTNSGVHRWDDQTLSNYGDQPQGSVYALTIWNDLLVAGGDFWYNQDHSRVLHNVAVLQGTGWWPFGTGTDGSVDALAVYRGELIIGGGFGIADGHVADGIARWHEGTFWHMSYPGPKAVVDPQKRSVVEALLVHDDALWVGGNFVSIEASAMASLARWDGAWNEIGDGVVGRVTCLAPAGTGVFVGGEYTAAGDVAARGAAIYDDGAWTPLGDGVDYWPEAAQLYEDALWVGGVFRRIDGDLVARFAGLWSDDAWAPPPDTDGAGIDGTVNALIDYDGRMIAGGFFSSAGRTDVQHLAAWDGLAWSVLADPPPNRQVTRLGVWGSDLVVAGNFTEIGGVAADGLAIWDGLDWQGVTGLDDNVLALADYRNELVIGGRFETVDGVTAAHAARFDGVTWRPLAAGLDDNVHALLVRNSRLLVGGEFQNAGTVPASRLAAWDGWAWKEYGGGADGDVLALAEFGDDLLAGGYFDAVGGIASKRVARKVGNDWLPLGDCFVGQICYWVGPDDMICETTGVSSFAVIGDRIFAGGSILRSGSVDTPGVACWHAAEGWTALGTGLSNSQDLLASGAVLFAGGRRQDVMSASGLNAWHEPSITDAGSPPATAALRLERPRPNPFNPSTELRFTLERAGSVRLAVHDLRGRCVRILHDGRLPAGDHALTWNGRDDQGLPTASGVYMAVLEADGRRPVRTVVMSK